MRPLKFTSLVLLTMLAPKAVFAERVLFLEGSPRGEQSASSKVAKEFIKAYLKVHPTDTVDVLNVWNERLPELTGDTLEARYAIMNKTQLSAQQKKAWEKVTETFKRFARADKYIISVPMWNFGVPYKFKHYMDIVTQPDMAFLETKSGSKGQITDKPVVIFYSSGGDYSAGTPAEKFDHRKRFVGNWLKFIGFKDKDISEVPIMGTLSPEAKEHKQKALTEATQLAETWGK